MVEQIKIVCVNAQNYLGKGVEYVNRLYRAVRANTTLNFEFIVFTDETNPSGYYDTITVREIEDKKLVEWYNKVWLFKHNLFPDGCGIIYIDLDTDIVGNIDDFLQIDTDELYCLNDLYYPTRPASGLMIWNSNQVPDVYEYHKEMDYFRRSYGDMDVIQSCVEHVNGIIIQRLQLHLPLAYIVSYKRDGLGLTVSSYEHHIKSKNIHIVCFHGLPRPHVARPNFLVDYK